MQMKKIALAAVLIGSMAGASAQVYVAGNVGQSHFSIDCTDASCDKSDMGYKLTAGYKLNPMVALEASYVNFGKLKVRGTDDAGDPFSGDLKTSGLLFAAAVRYEAAPAVSLVGRLGLSSLKTKLSSSLGGGDTSSTKPYFGIGAEYSLNKQMRLTAGADFTRAKVDNDSGSVRLLSVGAQYDF